MDLRLFIIAITPGIVLLVAIYLTDRLDREPIKLLLLTFALGALAVIPAIIVEEILIRFNIFTGVLAAAYNAFIVASLTEEFFKRLVVLKLPYKTKYFNEKLDGIVYGVFASMGFATVENIMYVAFRYTNNPFIGLYRGIFSVPAHAAFGVTMGYYLSLARFETDDKKKASYMRKSLIMPILFHGIFDFILMIEYQQLLVLFVPYVLIIWFINARKLSKFVFDSRSRITRRKE